MLLYLILKASRTALCSWGGDGVPVVYDPAQAVMQTEDESSSSDSFWGGLENLTYFREL